MWEIIDGKLQKEFVFQNYDEVIEFVSRIRDEANKLNHHPDVLIHSYKKARVFLVTHDAGNQVTELDYKLAGIIDSII